MMGAKHPFKPRPRERKAAIIAAIQAAPHRPDRAIAEQFGITRSSVQQLRADTGLPRNPQGRHARPQGASAP
jgi:hypothetical protein